MSRIVKIVKRRKAFLTGEILLCFPGFSSHFLIHCRFYWSINLGALISYTGIAYVCQYGIPFLGGENDSFVVGYSIPTITMGR